MRGLIHQLIDIYTTIVPERSVNQPGVTTIIQNTILHTANAIIEQELRLSSDSQNYYYRNETKNR